MFVPLRAFRSGSNVVPISLPSAVTGTDIEMGGPLKDGVDGPSAGVDAFGVGAGTGVAGLGAETVAGVNVGVGAMMSGTVTVVDAVPAPAGATPANTVAAAKTKPPVATAADARRFRLTVCSLCVWAYTV